VDVIKTRIMTTRGAGLKGGVLLSIINAVREEGFGVLFLGLMPRLLYLAPLGSLVFSTYTKVSKVLLDQRENPPPIIQFLNK